MLVLRTGFSLKRMPRTRSQTGNLSLAQLILANMEQSSSEESATSTSRTTTASQDSTRPSQGNAQQNPHAPATPVPHVSPESRLQPIDQPPRETPQTISPPAIAPRQEPPQTISQPATATRQENPQSSPHLVAPPPSRSIRSTTTQRARRLAQAREEALKIKLEIAQARIAAMEAEASDDEDAASVISTVRPERRIDEWLESSHRHVLAITNAPHVDESEPAAPQYLSQARQENAEGTGQDATAARSAVPAPPPAGGSHAPIFVPAPPHAHVQPPPAYPQADTRENYAVATQNPQNINLSELASAIAIAARTGHREAPRYHAELPPFAGSHQEWLSFKAAYTETASNYSEVENIARLRRCLKGRAKEAVDNLLIYNARADEVMRSLEARFGRPDAIALAELERLRALPRLNDGPLDICVFASRVANTIATLKALDRAHYLHSPETTRAMMEKFTPALRYRWFDYATTHKTDEPELLKISAFLQREADYCALYAQPENVDGPNHHFTKRAHRAFVTTDKPSPRCACCNNAGHHIEKCNKYAEKALEDRWKIAKDQRLCFRCLRPRTRTHACKRVKCERDGCEYYHHNLLHYKKIEQRNEAVTSTRASREARAYLKIIPVTISGPAGAVETYALLDDGSTITLVQEDIARDLGLDGPTIPLQIEAITKEKIDASRSRRVILSIRGADRHHRFGAHTIEDLRLSPQSIRQEDLRDCTHLRDIESHLKYENAKPKVLIGQDNWHLLVSNETRRGEPHQPVASLTPLGWVLHGAHTRITGKRVHAIHHVNICENEKSEDLNSQLGKYFALESLLIEPKLPQSSPEERARAILAQSMKTTADGHYEAPLLWKQPDARLPDNYENTLKRLHNIEKKLDKNEELKRKYNEQMDALIIKGYAEPAPPSKSERVWYLPHFPVLNPSKPGKMRIVHDAAAATRGVSLNDRLLTGPDLLQSLPGVLMRFRQHPIAVGADIKEMFMQVKVKPEDRDALRYLWRGDQRGDQPPREYRMTSLIFGATCSPSIAIHVKNVNAQKHEDTHPEAVKAIVRHHYVDDYLHSFKTEEEAIRVSSAVRDIHKEAHYELRQWTSNSPKVLRALTSEDLAATHVDLNKNEMQNERVLGQIWKPTSDELAFNLDLTRLPAGALDDAEPTKRHILKITMSIFDPLGLATPVTIIAKKLLQEVWRRGTGWDDKLDSDLAQRWAEWTRHLRALRDLAIPRAYPHYGDSFRREIHVFVDASESAYTSALYWRTTTTDGRVHVSLIAAKAKVAPLKVMSIPRLEIQAAAMGSRMAAAVIEEHDLKPDTKTFWTDSRTVLAWLRAGARTYKPFVAHRIAAIEEYTTVKEWRWVPTKLNVADEATREVPPDFDNQHRWFRGPDFLRDDPSTWPTEPSQPHECQTNEERVHTMRIEKEKAGPLAWLPDPARFSRWERLLRTIGRVLQFTDLCRPRHVRAHYKRTTRNKQADPEWNKQRKPTQPPPLPPKKQQQRKYKILDASYLHEAERLVIRASQLEAFSDDVSDLRNNKPPSTHSRLRHMAVELVNDVIVIKTRIDAATDITELQRRPPVLDGDHPAVKLYIDYVHRQMQHNGAEATINECKQHYSILRLRPVTKMIVHRCLPCRIKKTLPSTPPTGDHPRCRLAHHQRPFSYTGVDIFGPLTVTVGRGTRKRYVALFTCLTTRAVHLEVIPSLTGDSAVMALRRMVARRGCPTEIWSDNGTNFHSADKELREVYESALAAGAAQRAINWRFIPAGAPFMGGAWERMVRAVKRALHAVLDERRPSEEVLTTLLAEAEYTVNSRPLTHVAVDPDEPEAITPNHFLLGGSARAPNPGTFDDSTLIGRATWRTSQRLAEHFWARWLREYLPSLQYRREPHGRGRPICVGDIVLVADGNLPRNTWPRGRVTATYPGPDGVTRAVDVCTKGGVFRRPTKKLVILPTEPDDLHATNNPTLTRAMDGGRDVQDGLHSK